MIIYFFGMLCGLQDLRLPNEEWNLDPLQRNCRVLTPGLPGNSLIFILKMGKIRPEERKWRLGAKLNLRPRCPDSQLRTLMPYHASAED